MSVYSLHPGQDFATMLKLLKSGDTLRIHPGYYLVTPKEALRDAAEDSASFLANLQDVTVEGLGNPTICTNIHGNPLCIWNCVGVTVKGITFDGPGVLTAPNKYYYALILLHGINDRITIQNCVFRSGGNHGIGHLSGPRTTWNSRFIGNRFEHGGNYGRTDGLLWDGAAWACGGGGNWFVDNEVVDWLRGAEIEGHDIPVDATGTIVSRNRFESCAWQTILVTPTSGDSTFYRDIMITNNVISGSQRPGAKMGNCGIYVSGSTGIQIIGNTIRDIAGGIGILLHTNDGDINGALVASNRITGADQNGIHIGPGATNKIPTLCTLSGNQIRNCGSVGFRIQGSFITAENNRLSGING